MLGGNIRVRTVPKQERSNCKKRKCHVNLDSVTGHRKSHENFNKKINFRLTLKLTEIIRTSTFIIKKLKTLI